MSVVNDGTISTRARASLGENAQIATILHAPSHDDVTTSRQPKHPSRRTTHCEVLETLEEVSNIDHGHSTNR